MIAIQPRLDALRTIAAGFPSRPPFAVGLADTIEGLTNIAHDGIDEDFHRDETPPSRKTGSAGPMRTPLGTDVSGVTPARSHMRQVAASGHFGRRRGVRI